MPKPSRSSPPTYFPVPLEEFLCFVIGGKYKHRRHAVFYSYFLDSRKMTPEEIEPVIQYYWTEGVSKEAFFILERELRNWLSLCRIARAKKAAEARWKKSKTGP